MKCKLCLQEKKLLQKSHIIPDFMYQELFDENHKLISFVTSDPKRAKSVSSGEYESNILCKDCDNKIIGALETYASKFLYGGRISVKTKDFIKPDGLKFTQVYGVDYSKLKLFLLSILWRASISSRPFFKNVSLGNYEEEIRQMIINSDAGLPAKFPCILTSFLKTKFPKKLIMAPKKFRFNNKTGYNFLAGGISYMFIITKDEKTEWILESILNKVGELKIIHIEEQRAELIFKKILGIQIS